MDRCIRVYDENRYLVLFGPEKYDAIYNRTGFFIDRKSGITFVFSYNFAKIKVDSLPLEKTLTFCNVNILIKSVFN